MKIFTHPSIVLFVYASFLGCMSQLPSASPETSVVSLANDNESVQATVAQFVDAWNHNDVNEMHDLASTDSLWILRNGNVWRGKAEVKKFYAMVRRIPTDNLAIEKLEVRSMSAQVALATARMKYNLDGTEFHTRDSFVFGKQSGSWKIAHFQSTVIEPAIVKNDRPDFGAASDTDKTPSP
ncbi:MAG: YybH family protein [Pirellula sp.]